MQNHYLLGWGGKVTIQGSASLRDVCLERPPVVAKEYCLRMPTPLIEPCSAAGVYGIYWSAPFADEEST